MWIVTIGQCDQNKHMAKYYLHNLMFETLFFDSVDKICPSVLKYV